MKVISQICLFLAVAIISGCQTQEIPNSEFVESDSTAVELPLIPEYAPDAIYDTTIPRYDTSEVEIPVDSVMTEI